jgi:NTE family protein
VPSKLNAIFLSLLLSASISPAQQLTPPPTTPSEAQQSVTRQAPPQSALPALVPANRPAIGLTLEGGGALGLAHIGVLQWFEDHHIPIDRIAGTSMGALVGAIYSTGHSPAEMRALATSSDFTNIFTLRTPYVDSSFRRRQDRRQTPTVLTVGLAHGAMLRNAVLTDRGVNQFLATNLLGYNSPQLDYNRLPIPFRCVATDLNTFEPVTFAGGSLAQAVRSSISIPGVFPPVQDATGHFLADGGIVDNLPTDVLRNDLHADVVIAIRLEDSQLGPADVSSIVGVLNRAFSVGIVRNVNHAVQLADIVVNVPVADYSATDYTKAGKLIQEGYLAAEANSKSLLPYALNPNDWAAYLTDRDQRREPQPGILRQVRVEGGLPGARQQALSDLKPLEGQPISAAKTLNALNPVQSNGVYSATFQTFVPQASAPQPASATGAAPSANTPAATPLTPDSGILVHLANDPTGPPFLIISPELAAETSNITRMELSLRFVDQNLGGYGSELRANGDVGYKTALNAEYYRLLTPGGFFLEPRAGIVREPVYIWANQKRVAERLQQNLDAGVECGRTFSNWLQVSAGWRAEDTHWSLTTGSGGGPYLSGTAQEGLLHILIDRETSGSISPSGFRLSAAAGAFYHAQSSANAPLVIASASRTWQWKATNIFALTGDVNSYLRANVAQPYRFTLGGPRMLSASSMDEYRGTDTYLARAAYLHRIAALPTGLGEGLYGVFGYEAGEIWSPESRAILRQDVSAGLLAATPIGSISVGGSVGDAGHRKFFITIGRLF